MTSIAAASPLLSLADPAAAPIAAVGGDGFAPVLAALLASAAGDAIVAPPGAGLPQVSPDRPLATGSPLPPGTATPIASDTSPAGIAPAVTAPTPDIGLVATQTLPDVALGEPRPFTAPRVADPRGVPAGDPAVPAPDPARALPSTPHTVRDDVARRRDQPASAVTGWPRPAARAADDARQTGPAEPTPIAASLPTPAVIAPAAQLEADPVVETVASVAVAAVAIHARTTDVPRDTASPASPIASVAPVAATVPADTGTIYPLQATAGPAPDDGTSSDPPATDPVEPAPPVAPATVTTLPPAIAPVAPRVASPHRDERVSPVFRDATARPLAHVPTSSRARAADTERPATDPETSADPAPGFDAAEALVDTSPYAPAPSPQPSAVPETSVVTAGTPRVTGGHTPVVSVARTPTDVVGVAVPSSVPPAVAETRYPDGLTADVRAFVDTPKPPVTVPRARSAPAGAVGPASTPLPQAVTPPPVGTPAVEPRGDALPVEPFSTAPAASITPPAAFPAAIGQSPIAPPAVEPRSVFAPASAAPPIAPTAAAPIAVADPAGATLVAPPLMVTPPAIATSSIAAAALPADARVPAVAQALPVAAMPVADVAAADRHATVAVAAAPRPDVALPPAAPAILPALQAFGAQLHRAAAAERRALRDPEAQPVAALAPAAAIVAPTAAPAVDTTAARWPETMVARIEALRDQQNAPGAPGDTRIRLHPDALGTVDVTLRQDASGTHVQLHAAEPATVRLLADAQPRLQAIAETRGLRLAGSEVGGAGTQTGTGQGWTGDRRQPAPAPTLHPRAPVATPAPTDDPTDTRLA